MDVSGTISTATLNWDDEDFEIESKIAASFNNAGHSWSTVAVTGSIDTGEVVVDHDVFYDSVTVTSSLEYCTSGGGYGYGYGCDDLPAAEMILCPSKDTSNIDTSHLHDFVRGTDSSTDASWVLVDDLYAVDFDGTNSIDVPSDSAFPQNAAPHSITFWIKADSIGGTILDMEDQYQVYLSGTNLYYRFFEVGSSDFFGRFVSFDDTTSIHHIGLVWNGNNDSSGISVYVDGDYVEGVPQSTGTVSSYSGTALGLTIGDGFDGKLDDIRFYNAELSSAQIAVLASERGICIEEAEIGGLVGGGVANNIPERELESIGNRIGLHHVAGAKSRQDRTEGKHLGHRLPAGPQAQFNVVHGTTNITTLRIMMAKSQSQGGTGVNRRHANQSGPPHPQNRTRPAQSYGRGHTGYIAVADRRRQRQRQRAKLTEVTLLLLFRIRATGNPQGQPHAKQLDKAQTNGQIQAGTYQQSNGHGPPNPTANTVHKLLHIPSNNSAAPIA